MELDLGQNLMSINRMIKLGVDIFLFFIYFSFHSRCFILRKIYEQLDHTD